MSIFEGSRYIRGENGKKITASKVTKDGKTITFLHDRRMFIQKDMKETVSIHETNQSDLLDLLSHNSCGISTRWFLIADINGMFYPDDEIDKGRILLIPSFTDFGSV